MPECQPRRTVDSLIELVTSTRRRRILRHLAVTTETVIEREDLAVALHLEEDVDLASMETVLGHQHLPKLDDAGVIEYDHRSGTVRPDEALEALIPLLDACADLRESLK